MPERRKKIRCFVCKKIYDTSKENYGWHVNKKGELEKCAFQIMPMQYVELRGKLPQI